uniref:N-acetyltransferase domain-containing protein n=1 Tax=Panagrolaimus superbus TaxID=310955 RepID=A0A914YDV0_9BILA
MNFSGLRLIRFCVLNATKNSTRIYNPASQLNSNQFVSDRNSHLKRPIFVEQKKYGNLPIICEKALPEDDDLLIDFYVTHFSLNEPLNATLNHTPEEAHELMTALIKESTDNFILRDNEKVIGCYTLKKGFLNEKPRKQQRLEDYGQIVDSGPFKHRKNNIITTILEASECNIYDKMEPPCTYYYGMMGSLHPKYLGKKIAEITLIALMKFCISEGARYYIGDNTGDGVAKLYCKLPGFEIIDKFNYADFKVHGKSIIDKLVDGSKNTSVIYCDFENCKNIYLKD